MTSYIEGLIDRVRAGMDDFIICNQVIDIINQYADEQRELKKTPVETGQFSFGKYRGLFFEDVVKLDYKYCQWLGRQSFISEDERSILYGVIKTADFDKKQLIDDKKAARLEKQRKKRGDAKVDATVDATV